MNIFEQLITIDEYIKKHRSKTKSSTDKDHVSPDPAGATKAKGKKRKPLETVSKDLYNIFGQGNL